MDIWMEYTFWATELMGYLMFVVDCDYIASPTTKNLLGIN